MANAPSFSLMFIIRNTRMVNGLAPIYARISVNTQRTEFAIKRNINPDSWNSDRGMAKPKTREANEINPYLEKIRKRILDCHSELLLAGKEISAQLIKQLFFGEEEQTKRSSDLFEYHNMTFQSRLAPGTFKHYLTTQKYFNEFLSINFHQESIRLDSIDYRFLTDFEFFLRKRSGKDKSEKMANNTTMKHFCRLRKMLNLAERLQWLLKNPFKLYKLQYENRERGFLYDHQLATIEEKAFSIEILPNKY